MSEIANNTTAAMAEARERRKRDALAFCEKVGAPADWADTLASCSTHAERGSEEADIVLAVAAGLLGKTGGRKASASGSLYFSAGGKRLRVATHDHPTNWDGHGEIFVHGRRRPAAVARLVKFVLKTWRAEAKRSAR